MHYHLIQDFLDKCESQENGIVYHSNFSTLSLSLDYQPAVNREKYPDHVPKWASISKHARNIDRDIDLLDSIVHRIMYHFSKGDELDIDPRLLNRYVTADLETFHVIYRSLFDHIALININLSDNPGQFGIDSFTKQRNRILNNNTYRERIGNNLFELIQLSDWFDQIRTVRDSIIHHGGLITYDFTAGHLFVDVHPNLIEEEVLPNQILSENNRIVFEWYAALMMVYLYSYLELIDQLALEKLNFIRMGANTGMAHPIITSYHEWINTLVET